MKYITAAVIIILVLLSMTACSGMTTNENEILDEVRGSITENTTVKELLDKIDTIIQEKHAETSGNETPGYIPEGQGEEDMGYPRIEQNAFNSAELVLVENTPEEYVFRMNFYLDGVPVNFSVGNGPVVFLYLWEGGFTPDFSKGGGTGQENSRLLLEQEINGHNSDWYQYLYTSSDDLLHLKKSEILPTEETELTAIILLQADYFEGNNTGLGPDKSMELHSFVWMNLIKDW
jgi:hypothetical protein